MANYKFSSTLQEAHRRGAMHRSSLVREANKAAKRAIITSSRDTYLDTMFAGPTGIGKTWNVIRGLEEAGAPYVVLQGGVSMFALGCNLMLYVSRIPEGERLVVVIDDCDSFFEKKENINILKGMTGEVGSRFFRYTKKIQEHMLTDHQLEVLPDFQNDGAHGFTVPVDNVVFVLTTNTVLPTASEVDELQDAKGATAQVNRKRDLEAIRGRFNTKDIKLSKDEMWGWLAEIALNDGGLDMLENEHDRFYLMEWVYNNWDRMKERSARTLEKMAYEMIDYPEDYKDIWETDFLLS